MENRREGFTLLAPLPLLQQNEFKSLFKSTLLHACVTELWLSERVGGGGRGEEKSKVHSPTPTPTPPSRRATAQ